MIQIILKIMSSLRWQLIHSNPVHREMANLKSQGSKLVPMNSTHPKEEPISW